ncbi:MAG TPA: DUF5916 domain-containing protein [Gemmatimonadaceae bacterium]|nr:DUF5916 domain-containing protein [Gemmatimonadaceae bacterium]HMN09977.1 DUF5916 domain-containing protein [Gemmatimonadaceae bacterium]
MRARIALMVTTCIVASCNIVVPVRVTIAQASAGGRPPVALAEPGSRVARVAPPTSSAAPAPRSLRVARVATPIRIDGRLDDPAWLEAVPQRDFKQIEPRQGSEARFDTEVRLAQDDRFLYVAMRAFDSAGRDSLRARDLKRDFYWGRSDSMGLIIDGVGDRRSILAFGVSAFGAQWDAQVTDGGLIDNDWDGVWQARTSTDSAGWTAEFALPWSTLRYTDGGGDWRINFTRESPRIGETTAWSEFPRNFGPFRMEFAALTEGIRPPSATSPVIVRPYVVAAQRMVGARDDRTSAGGEVKWQPNASAVIDLTVNTDFAAADVDRQVVNLTRFNAFFPERRPFFLEHRGLFTVGAPERILPFFTRSVGLTENGSPLPIDGGVRAVYRGAEWSGAALAIRQGEAGTTPSATLGVVRAQRTFGRRLRIGALAVERWSDATSATPGAAGATLAIDAFARPSAAVTLSAMVSRAEGGSAGGDGFAWWGEAARSSRGVEAVTAIEYVGKDYTPVAGFVARGDLVRNASRVTLDWRPRWRPAAIRGFRPSLSENVSWRASDRRFQEAQVTARLFGADFMDRGRASLDVIGEWQALDRPFAVVPGVTVAPGDYSGARVSAEYQSSYARALAVSVNGVAGRYFDGQLRSATTRLSWAPRPHVTVDAAHTMAAFDGVGGREGRYVTHLLAPEVRLAATPRLQLALFYQHNTAVRQGALNARFVWEYAPLSTVAIVFNSRAALPDRSGGLVPAPARDGQLVMKLSWTRLP